MSGGRSRLRLDERRDQLLDVGLALFSERSYDDVQIDDIATAAGTSKGLLYHYFGGKRAFYVAVVRFAADNLLARIDTDPEADGPDRVRASLRGYLDYVAGRSGAFQALLQGGLGADAEVAEVVRATRSAIVTHMAEAIGLTELRPHFRLAMRAWIGAVEAASLDWLEHRDLEMEELVELGVQSLHTHLMVAATADPEAGAQLGDPDV